MRDDIIKKLFKMKDEKYHNFHVKLCPGLENMIGVRMPDLRLISKDILKTNPKEFLRQSRGEYYEETMLEGLVIAGMREPTESKLQRLGLYIPRISNWAICDTICASCKFTKQDLPRVWDFILQYRWSQQEFELRFMIVMMMDYFLLPEYLARVFEIIDQNKNHGYYVEMALAWLVSVAFVKHRDKTLLFLQHNQLSSFAQNKAIQKIRDSLRVTPTDKQLVLAYRRH